MSDSTELVEVSSLLPAGDFVDIALITSKHFTEANTSESWPEIGG
jgi:hypothetical protein